MYFIDHTIAFAIDAPIKASDIQKIDQNIDELDSRVAAVEAVLPVVESSIDWANAGGISQGTILDDEISQVGDGAYATKKYVAVYIPASANALDYTARMKSANGNGYAFLRLKIGGTDGAALSTASSSYTNLTGGSINVSALSGWNVFEIQIRHSVAGDTGYAEAMSYRII